MMVHVPMKNLWLKSSLSKHGEFKWYGSQCQ